MDVVRKIRLCGLLLLSFFSFSCFAELPAGFYLDHGYTFFTMNSVNETVNGKRIDKGWQLSGHIRMFGNAPARSSIKLVVKKDGKVLAQRRTNSKVLSVGHPSLTVAAGNTVAGKNQPYVLSGFNHDGKLSVVNTGAGEYEVDVYYVDGDTDKEYFAHTYTIDVYPIQTLDAINNEQVVRPVKWVVSRHQESLSSILSSWTYYTGDLSADRMIIMWSVSPADMRLGLSTQIYLRCSVDGEPIKLPKDDVRVKDRWRVERFISEEHIDRNALEYRGGSGYKEKFIQYEMWAALPIADDQDAFPPAGYNYTSPYVHFKQYPGRWECRMLDNGELIRTFAWDVDKKGNPVPHPEQKEGLTLNPGAILVDTYIPENGSKLDSRVVPDAVEEGGFYGWEWESDEMEDLVDEMPEIGTKWPTLSAENFVPEPDKGPSAAELLKAKQAAEAKAAAEKREAERIAREQRNKAEQEAYQKELAAREAENDRIRQEAYESELAKTQAAVAEQIRAANEATEAAMDRVQQSQPGSSTGSWAIIMRILLGLSLVLSGLLLAKEQLSFASSVTDKLAPVAAGIGLLTIGLSLFDFILDLIALLPIIGDGLVQVTGIAAGAVLAQAKVGAMISNPKVNQVIASLSAKQALVGYGAIAVGVLHLIIGNAALI